MKRFDRVKAILEDAVEGKKIGAHGNFWREATLEQFKAKRVFGRLLLVAGNADESNLIRALEGRDPFGANTGVPTALFNRMPDGFPPVDSEKIAVIRAWIADGCPDEEEAAGPPTLAERATVYWREFDNWSMFQATPEVQDAIGVFFDRVPLWAQQARDPSSLPAWEQAIQSPDVMNAVQFLGSRIIETAHRNFGDPVELEPLLECYAIFGADGLPDDPLRPNAPRHNMNGAVMWFFYSAMVDAHLRTETGGAADPWKALSRAVLIGMINDGLLRGRFAVQGFPATAAGVADAMTAMKALPEGDLLGELSRRYIDSGLNL